MVKEIVVILGPGKKEDQCLSSNSELGTVCMLYLGFEEDGM
jgi:hypothetical protein